MSNRSWLIWALSLAFLVAWLLYEQFRTNRLDAASVLRSRYGGSVWLLLLAIAASIVVVAVQQPYEVKGADPPPVSWMKVALLYASMLLGMVGQAYFFAKSDVRSDIGSVMKPFLASPIVFIPLASSYQSNLLSAAPFALADLMILLVAFQNGFFWKAIFDKQSEGLKGAAERKAGE
jgi:hypothetical protein